MAEQWHAGRGGRRMSGSSTPLEKRHSSTRIGKATTTDALPLITTAAAFGVSRFAKTLLSYEAAHPEQTAYASHRTLARLCEMSGFVLRCLGSYRCEPANRLSLNMLATDFLERAVTPL